jgi:tRNA A-37 threonylcarbamoyl transferase component Bud32
VLHLTTLGALACAADDGRALGPAPPLALELLAILAQAGDRPVHADDAIALLWPGSPVDEGRRRLDALTAQVVGWLGVPAIAHDPAGRRLDAGVIASDVRDFEYACATGAPDHALRRYGGPFLADVPPPSTSFARWRDREAGRLEQMARWARDAVKPRRSSLEIVPGAQLGHGGRYRVLSEIGRGASATVYLARDATHDRLVAIKVLRAEVSEEISPERFQQEIGWLARLQHPHILPLFDSGALGPLLYSVTPFVEGGESLRARMGIAPALSLMDVVRIAREVADALAYAHAHGVVHRDIKPENVLLSAGHALLADFGIARATATPAAGRTTIPGMVLGTPHYMSPEQACGEPELDGRSDVYSLAAVLYELITGAPPFTGEPPRQAMLRRLSEVPPMPGARGIQVPAVVEDVLARALQPMVGDRIEAAAFADGLGFAERRLSRASPILGAPLVDG